jgi:uncharacterized protein YcbX
MAPYFSRKNSYEPVREDLDVTETTGEIRVGELWRYPVKSLAGETRPQVQLTPDGVEGDRQVHVRNARGPLTGRTRHGLLTLPGRTSPEGVPLVAGHRWDSPAALAAVRERAGADADLAAYDGPERFDVANLLVATDGAVAAFGYDVRRLRPNLLIAGVPPEAEAGWPGHALVIGDSVIGVYGLRARCIVTSIDPDTGAQDLDAFRHIRSNFDGKLALDSWVIRPGTVRVGDEVRIEATDERPTRIGGWIVGAPYEVA